MTKSRLLAAVCAFGLGFVSIPSSAALVGQLPLTPGGTDYQAAYDTVLDITWLTDAGLSGTGSWTTQLAWIDSLNTATHLGYNDWRLASMSVAAGLPTGVATSVVSCRSASELACRDNELSYMYYYNLGAISLNPATDLTGTQGDLTGTRTVGDVTLTDIQSLYWSGTEGNPFGDPKAGAWYSVFSSGGSATVIKTNNTLNGWAVRDGDVSAVPAPAALWLFGSGLLGLIGIARRKKT